MVSLHNLNPVSQIYFIHTQVQKLQLQVNVLVIFFK